jgi:hypothetical protein
VSLVARRLAPDYNCAHYTAELWEALTGSDIRTTLCGLMLPAGERIVDRPTLAGAFVSVPAPQEPCLVLFRRARAAPHVGVFLRGRVSHLTQSGPIRQVLDVARIGYSSVRFYAARPPRT